MSDQLKSNDSDTQTTQVSAVLRTFSILEYLADQEHANLETISHNTGLAKPTTLRFLSTLRDLGYVYRDENDQYFCTLKLFSIGSKALEHIDLPRIAQPIAAALSEELKETVHLGIQQENEVVYIIKVESKYTIRMHSRIGKRIPLYCTALGKIMLATYSEEALRTYAEETELIAYSPETITTADALVDEIRLVRREGFAYDRGEHDGDSRCIAAAIRNHSGAVIAAISVSWPGFRYNSETEESAKKVITQAALKISACFGYSA